MSVYISFGQSHTHSINGVTIDKDCIVEVKSRERAFELFGRKFCFQYSWDDIKDKMHYFPRGVIKLN